MGQTDDTRMQTPLRNAPYVVVVISVLMIIKMLEIKYNTLLLWIVLHMLYKTYNLSFCNLHAL